MERNLGENPWKAKKSAKTENLFLMDQNFQAFFPTTGTIFEISVNQKRIFSRGYGA